MSDNTSKRFSDHVSGKTMTIQKLIQEFCDFWGDDEAEVRKKLSSVKFPEDHQDPEIKVFFQSSQTSSFLMMQVTNQRGKVLWSDFVYASNGKLVTPM